MKIACLILAHKDPQQVKKLIHLLTDEQIDFFIHLDKKTNIIPFQHELSNDRITFIKNRVRTNRGELSLVQATINSLEEITKKDSYNYINFISGQDLPLISGRQFVEFLSINKGTEFICAKPYDATDIWWKKNEPRLFEYNLQNWKIPGKYTIQKIMNAILPKRMFPDGYTLTGNSQWFCITTDCAKYILKSIHEKSPIVNYFNYVWGSDEFFFSTIVYNSSFKENIKENLHFVKWDNVIDGHPETLEEKDYNEIINSEKIFARKFDKDHDEKIIRLIEERIEENKTIK